VPGFCSSGRFIPARARVGPRPWSRFASSPCQGFVLATWSSCRGPRLPAEDELAVVPPTTPGSPNSNAWPARPRRATSRHILGPTGLSAFQSVPSGAKPRADLTEPHSIVAGSAAFLINNGAQFPIGINGIMGCNTGPSMSPPKSSPRSKLSFFGFVPPLKAYLPRVDPTSGFPGSPSAVRRGTRSSSSLASPVSFVCSCALPVSSVAFELSGWWLRQVCDLIGSVQPSIRFDHLI
jgi:hypothetical protein